MDVDKAPDTNGWPGQLYVRTARRLVGEYVLTQKDIQLQTEIPDSIGLGFYAIDSHIARMLVLEDGTLATEGEMTLLVSPGPWGLPYRFITPKRRGMHESPRSRLFLGQPHRSCRDPPGKHNT